MLWIIGGLLVLVVILLGGGGILLWIVLTPALLLLALILWSDGDLAAVSQAFLLLAGCALVVTGIVCTCMAFDRLWQNRKLDKSRLNEETDEALEPRATRLAAAEKIEENLYRDDDGSFLVVTATGGIRLYSTERSARKYLGLELPPPKPRRTRRTGSRPRKPAAKDSSIK